MNNKLSKINLNDYKPLREVIFNSIREAIILGELKPGERLMEVQLADKMGVSRTPIREAIRKLELEGLVVMVPRKGAYVADLTKKDIIDVLEVRAVLDGLATQLAAERMTDSEQKELNRVFEQFAGCVEKNNLQGIIKKDIEFHDIIYKASRNEKLLHINNNVQEMIYRFRVIYLKNYNPFKDVSKEHSRIMEAIKERNPVEAQKWAVMHIKNQEYTIIKELKDTTS